MTKHLPKVIAALSALALVFAVGFGLVTARRLRDARATIDSKDSAIIIFCQLYRTRLVLGIKLVRDRDPAVRAEYTRVVGRDYLDTPPIHLCAPQLLQRSGSLAEDLCWMNGDSECVALLAQKVVDAIPDPKVQFPLDRNPTP